MIIPTKHESRHNICQNDHNDFFFFVQPIKMIQFKKIVLSEPEVQVFKLLSEV